MHILVCIKPVPAAAAPSADGSIDRSQDQIINPADLNALELALSLKTSEVDKVSVLTMGAPGSEKLLRQAGAMGADVLYLVTDASLAGADTYATATVLSRAAEQLGSFDLILCGRKSTDGETGQVGPETAALLGLACITNCVALQPEKSGATCKRLLDEVYEQLWAAFPFVATIYNSVNSPRLPSLMGLAKANSLPLQLLDRQALALEPEQCGLAGSPTRVVSVTARTMQKRQAVRLPDTSEGHLSLCHAVCRAAEGGCP